MTTGHVWAQDRRNLAEYLTRKALTQLSAEILERASGAPSKKERKAIRTAARTLQSRGALTKAVPELQAHPDLTLLVEDFDADDWKLNTPSGLVDLRTGVVEASDPSALCSKSTAVAPSEHLKPTRWLSFLEELTDGDEELQAYLQRLVGYSLTGSTQEQILAFIHGPPMTGKSVFIDTLAGVFGSYHVTAAADTFAAVSGNRHPTDLAALAGARLVTAVETSEGKGWDTQRVKVITGGDEVSARFMRQDFFSYKPRYQIIIVGNHEPEINGVDDALMRRLHVVPFEHRPEDPDRLLAEKLKGEWPGILQWAIEGCKMWIDDGLAPPRAVVDRTEQYRREEDPVGLFLDEMCEMDDEAVVSRRELYQAWSRWCHSQGEDPGSLKQLKRRFRGKQMEYGWSNARTEYNGKHCQAYRGLRLTEHDDILTEGEDG